MPLPVSAGAQIRRLHKIQRELERLDRDAEIEDTSVLVAEICNACMLLLDKSMNAIWAKKANPAPGKNKPNIYFPICASEEKLVDKLTQYQMPTLTETDKELTEAIESAQPYRDAILISNIYKLAILRHESLPEIERNEVSGIGIGKGQDLYIESLTVNASGNINSKGQATNQKSGLPEKVRIEFTHEVKSTLKDLDMSPDAFCRTAIEEVVRLTREIFRLI